MYLRYPLLKKINDIRYAFMMNHKQFPNLNIENPYLTKNEPIFGQKRFNCLNPGIQFSYLEFDYS